MLSSSLDCSDVFGHKYFMAFRYCQGHASHLAKRVGSPDLLSIISDEEAHGVGHYLNSARVDHDLSLLG